MTVKVTRNCSAGVQTDVVCTGDDEDQIAVQNGHLLIGNAMYPVAIYAPGIWQSAKVIEEPKPNPTPTKGVALRKTRSVKKA